MIKQAKLSRSRIYRYALWRIWDDSLPLVMFICLNPSTADETCDDPTLVRCVNYARAWGYGGVCMANLFAFRATRPQDLRRAGNPVGPWNDFWLRKLSAQADLIVAAWGNGGAFKERAALVRDMFGQMFCLKLNKSGYPAHPLYQKADVQIQTLR